MPEFMLARKSKFVGHRRTVRNQSLTMILADDPADRVKLYLNRVPTSVFVMPKGCNRSETGFGGFLKIREVSNLLQPFYKTNRSRTKLK